MKTSQPKHKTKKRKRTGICSRYENKCSINGRIWISKKEETFLGYGRVVLLERIKDYGSITKAAKSMGMSYRNAWELVASMNKLSEKPLIVGGGLSNINDIKSLLSLKDPLLEGIIAGKSFYLGKIEIKAANKILD